MRSVVQIAPEIAAGSGVEGVAYNLERAFQAAGVPTERFTMIDARGDWLPRPSGGMRGKLILALRVFWFSTVGTFLARRFLARRPGSITLCHNDVLAGEIYVNHGILRAAMRARGRYALRMLRNPLHLFTALRDALRYRSKAHRVVVTLTEEESQLLRRTYPRLRPRSVVIGNGVDIEHFRPPSTVDREQARAQIGIQNLLPADAVCVVFVGHEFDRKGLPVAIEALAGAASAIHLLVAGGTPDMVRAGRACAERFAVAHRVHFLGQLADSVPAFWAADAFILPSAYESYALVVLEALACGLPVLVTSTGCSQDVVVEGYNGWLVERSVSSIGEHLDRLFNADLKIMSHNARLSALPHAWSVIAGRYLALLEELASEHRARQFRGVD